MPMNNPFDTPAFHVTALTAAINILPNSYGRLERMMLMPPRPVRFRQIAVEEKNGVLNLLPTLPIGSPGTVGERGKRKLAASTSRISPTTTWCCPRRSRVFAPSARRTSPRRWPT